MGRSSRRSYRPVLRDAVADRVLGRTGSVVIRLVSAELAAHIRRGFGDLHGWSRQQLVEDQAPDFEVSANSVDQHYHQQIARMVNPSITAAVERIFLEQRLVASSILVKWPAAEGTPSWDGVPDAFHADSPFVDERFGDRSFRMWMALQDTSEQNGGLLIVPHSHRLDYPLRGWGLDPPWLSYRQVYERRAIPLVLRAGEAVIFDAAVIHRSGPNRTSEPRAAVSVLLAEPDHSLSIFRRRDERSAEKVEVTRDVFTSGAFAALGELPPSEVVPVDSRQRSEAAIARRLDWYHARERISRALPRPARR